MAEKDMSLAKQPALQGPRPSRYEFRSTSGGQHQEALSSELSWMTLQMQQLY